MAITQTLTDGVGHRVYPKTIATSVTFDGDKSVDTMLKSAVYGTTTGTPTEIKDPIDATTLNGHNSNYYAKAEDLELFKQEILSDVSSGTSSAATDEVDEHDASTDAHKVLFKRRAVYVNGTTGSDNNHGTSESDAFKTIQAAIDNTPITAEVTVILVSPGTYVGNVNLEYRQSNLISISALNDAAGVNIEGCITIDTCNSVNLSKLNFLKPVQKIDSMYCNIIVYNSKVDISNCTFESNVTNGNSVAIYTSGSDTIIYNTTISNYTWAINAYSGYIKCYNFISSNNKNVFNSDGSIILYDSASKLNFSNQLSVSNRSGLVINESAAQYLNMFSNANSNNAASFHNSIYRGKDITNYLNDGTLFTRISNGTFDDLFIGDYFTMSISVDGYSVECNKYVLCGFDTYLGSGDEVRELTKHHAVVMPASRLFTAAMNDTNTTEGGYYNSKMHQEIMPKIATGIKTIIGDSHLITYRDILTNEETNSVSTNWDWYDTTCRLCSEMDIHGSNIWGNGYDAGLANRQLPIFKLYFKFYQGEDRSSIWLSSVASNGTFCYCRVNGACGHWFYPSDSRGGVRPRFLIG